MVVASTSTGSNVTDRGCLQLHLWLLQDARVLPTCSGGLLAPWSVVRHSSHLRRRVVVSFRQSSCDGHPLVSQPRAEPSLPPPLRSGGPVASSHHDGLLLRFDQKGTHRKRTLLTQTPGGGGGGVCVGGEGGGGSSFSLNLRVVHTLSVRSFLKTWPKKKLQRSSLVTTVARARPVLLVMFSLIKNEGDPRH